MILWWSAPNPRADGTHRNHSVLQRGTTGKGQDCDPGLSLRLRFFFGDMHSLSRNLKGCVKLTNSYDSSSRCPVAGLSACRSIISCIELDRQTAVFSRECHLAGS